MGVLEKRDLAHVCERARRNAANSDGHDAMPLHLGVIAPALTGPERRHDVPEGSRNRKITRHHGVLRQLMVKALDSHAVDGGQHRHDEQDRCRNDCAQHHGNGDAMWRHLVLESIQEDTAGGGDRAVNERGRAHLCSALQQLDDGLTNDGQQDHLAKDEDRGDGQIARLHAFQLADNDHTERELAEEGE